MNDIPKDVKAISYEVPLMWGDRHIGQATVDVEKVGGESLAAQYIARVSNEITITLNIDHADFEDLLGKHMVNGLSLNPTFDPGEAADNAG